MKKVLLTLLAAAGLMASANAQLTEGSLFPYPGGTSGGLTAVNAPFTGIRYNLDSLSNAGYTIFIDISATWCPPCWAYHNSKQLDTLWAQHGPTGAPGVNASTTNDVFVIFFQGEPTSHMAELVANTAEGAVLFTTTEDPKDVVTQGNWVTGTPYPIIDDTTSTDANYGTQNIDEAWNIQFFPTVYMICRDHLVHNLTQPSYADAYAAAQGDCPNYAPSSTVDAKATPYMGNGYYVCNTTANTLSFQNYSQTSAITSATVTVTDGTGATMATVPWSGSLAPYALGTVNIPSFAGTSFGGYKYTVSVTGDSNPSNNSKDSIFVDYNSSNAGTLPATEDFQETSTLPYKEYINSPDGYLVWGLWDNGEVGADGTAASASSLIAIFPNMNAGAVDEFVLGNFNTTSSVNPTLQFDLAYVQQSSSSNDNLSVKVSTDCGTTWTTPYSETGSAMATGSADGTTYWQPTAANDWKHVNVVLGSAADNNTVVKFVFTAGGGNNLFIDNIGLANGTISAVAQIQSINEISIAPNPAKDMTSVNLTLTEASNVRIDLMDAVGRVISTVSQDLTAGAQKIELSTENLPSGLYTVKIAAGNSVTTKQLSVVK